MEHRIHTALALALSGALLLVGPAPSAHADPTPNLGPVCTLADLDHVSDLLYETKDALRVSERRLVLEHRARKQQHRRANRLERLAEVQAGIIKRLRGQLAS